MQPQQFAVKATWTQLISPSRPGTFLPCRLRSHSSVFVNHVFLTSSTAAVVSLSWPLGGHVTDNTQTTKTSETIENTAPRKKTKYKLKKKEARPSKGSLPNNTNKTSFTREKTKYVLYRVYPLLTTRPHPAHPLYVLVLHPREDLWSQHRHRDTTSSCCNRSGQCNALMPQQWNTAMQPRYVDSGEKPKFSYA